MKDVAASKNLRLAASTYDFWEEIYTTIDQAIEDLDGLDHILKSFMDMVQICIVQSRKLDLQNTDLEKEQELLGISVGEFRDYACGIYMRTF